MFIVTHLSCFPQLLEKKMGEVKVIYFPSRHTKFLHVANTRVEESLNPNLTLHDSNRPNL